jgi:hypothetical protein
MAYSLQASATAGVDSKSAGGGTGGAPLGERELSRVRSWGHARKRGCIERPGIAGRFEDGEVFVDLIGAPPVCQWREQIA